eukprot:scaffold2618_cov19-Prasinocladus_malaysianus.AAC.1
MLCVTADNPLSRFNAVNQSTDALVGCHKANKSGIKPAASSAPKEAVVAHQLTPEGKNRAGAESPKMTYVEVLFN